MIANCLDATLLPDNAQRTSRLEIRSETNSRKCVVSRRSGRDRSLRCSYFGWKRHRSWKFLAAILPQIAATERAVNPRSIR